MRTALLYLALLLWVTSAMAQSNVQVNGQRLTSETIQTLRQHGVQVQDGAYWYDAHSGAWGFACGPTVGFLVPGLPVDATLPADASCGTTGVFVNGRQLHSYDVMALQQLVGAVVPGRYWMDGYANVGYEGGPALVNLLQLAQAQGAGGNTFYRSNNTGIGAGSSGGTSYVMGKDWSVIVGN